MSSVTRLQHKMNQGVIHPSIFMKIQTQHIPQVSTPKGQSGAFPYLKGSLHSLHPTTSDPRRASSSVLPISPVVVEAPLEKGNDVFSIQKGLAFRMIWAPFERVTFLMQCQNEIIKTGQLSNPYNGIINCVARTVRNERIFSLWRGNTACILEFLSYKHALYTGISGPMPMLLKFFGLQLGSWWHFTALGTATSVLVVTYPLDTVHHRMVMRSGEAIKYKSSFHAFSQILKTEGVGSLYKGATAQILKNIVFLCLVVLFIDEDCLFLSPAVLLGGLQKFVDPWALSKVFSGRGSWSLRLYSLIL
ncbi:hypothetical protein Patl1_07703 [Pistacia atlantica]|uniref:Uncharacterized protein n=1 Tax=Pistacia atlantica TaxID=434234 RepID=A0ACC1AJX1_9ROSI|nr:hypothetical protein Patl1_07703 [Pistacia atlantica]